MSEPQDNPQGPSEEKEAVEPSILPMSSLLDLVGNSPLAPNGEADDAPTIISRPQGRPLRPEESFAQKLRGRRLAHFDLLEPIGVGGMAAVVRARDTQLDREVALKILPPEMAADPENIQRFHQEARSAAKLDHENIARAFYCGEDQGLHFIAFEFVEGENLRTVLERRGQLDVSEGVRYMLQIAQGLTHAAGRGVVHRDIKPSNIIIGPGGRAKLVDMGLARSQKPFGNLELTQSGVTLGTFDYISPEQALEPRDADARSDIYSLGCTFYQMMTGQSPVPEGTAAKKLHHHQHVAPIDPRQINPAIPDELAAILGKTMAKDPKDRYQQPEHLVQHLLQFAARLGLVNEAPVDVRYADSPLPGPFLVRPLFVMMSAAFLLVLLVALHGMSSRPGVRPSSAGNVARGNDPTDRSNPDQSKDGATENTTIPRQADTPTLSTDRAQHDAHSAKDLAAFLDRRDPIADVYLVNHLDLTAEKTPGLVFQGRELTIQPKEPGQRRTIRLAYDADLRVGETEWNALTVRGGKVTLRELRFEVDARQAFKIMMSAVKLQESGRLVLEKCEFVQYNPPSAGRLGDIVVEGPRSEAARPSVQALACYFGHKTETPGASAPSGGQNVVTVSGTASLHFTNCAFGPHASLFHLRERGFRETDVNLGDCSAILLDGAAFQIDEGVSASLKVKNSILSRPEGTILSQASRTVLIQQFGLGNIRFGGSWNRYHNLSAFWLRDNQVLADTWEDFTEATIQGDKPVSDGKSMPLNSSPWQDQNPLRFLEADQPKQAFHANTRLPEMRQADKLRMLGVDECAWGATYATLPPVLEKKRELIVDPAAVEDGGGVYKKLGQAILAASPGDIIYVKHKGRLAIEPIRLESATLDLTIRPFRGYRPVLTLGETSDPDAALFHVHDSKLHLERLEFLLRPRPDFSTQVVTNMTGFGQCGFQQCTITMDPEGAEGVRLAAVSLADPKIMKMDTQPAREAPEVRFENCLIRGKGDGLTVRASRAFSLSARNSLSALSGSFLIVEGNSKEPPASPPVQISLSHFTGYLTGNLVNLRASKNGKHLVPIQFDPMTDCLFVAAERQALIHFEGDVEEPVLKRLLSWKGKHNVYSGFDHLLDQQPLGDDSPLAPYNQKEWEGFTHENFATKDALNWPADASMFERVAFENAAEEGTLIHVVPGDFRVTKSDADMFQGYGAILDQIPKPHAESKPTPVAGPDS